MGEILSVHTDHLETPRVLTDEAGEPVWRAAYQAFGQVAVEGDPDGDGQEIEFPIRFPGQYRDLETGLLYNRFRYFDPTIGRYLESDVMDEQRGKNPHLYVSAQPTVWVDPIGGSGAIGAVSGRPRGGGDGTIECDGNGNLVIVNPDNNKCTRDCSRLHEQKHIGDWIGRYGKDLCRNRAKGIVANARRRLRSVP